MEYEYGDDYTIENIDYSSDYLTPPAYGARPSDFLDSSSTIAPVPSPPEPTSNKAVMELLAAMRKAETKHGQELKKNARESHRNVERERHLEKHEKKISEDKVEAQTNNTKQKRDVLDTGSARDLLLEWRTALKRKRSISEHKHGSRRLVASGSSHRESLEDKQDT